MNGFHSYYRGQIHPAFIPWNSWFLCASCNNMYKKRWSSG